MLGNIIEIEDDYFENNIPESYSLAKSLGMKKFANAEIFICTTYPECKKIRLCYDECNITEEILSKFEQLINDYKKEHEFVKPIKHSYLMLPEKNDKSKLIYAGDLTSLDEFIEFYKNY